MTMKNFQQTGVASDVEFGKGGAHLKSSGGKLKATSNGSTPVQMGGADPTADDDFVTKRFLERKSDITVSGPLNGGSVPVVVEGQILYCTVSGGGFTAGEIYRGESGTWVLISKFAGMRVAFSNASVVGFEADTLYLWDSDGSAWVKIGPASAITNVVKTASVDITTADTGVAKKILDLPLNAIILKVVVDVTAIFTPTGTPATIVVGPTATPNELQAVTDNDPTALGLYESSHRKSYGPLTAINATLVKGTATTGQATVLVEYSVA